MVANDGIILNGNGEFLRMFGYELEEITGRNIDDIITSEDSLKEALNITDRVSSGLKVSFETVRTRRDGTKPPLLLSTTFRSHSMASTGTSPKGKGQPKS